MFDRLPSFRLSITVYLAAMAAGILVPFFLFVALLLAQLQEREHQALELRASAAANSIADSIERHLRDMATTLSLLASSPELASGDMPAFHSRTQAAMAGSPWFVIVVDETGQQLLNTRVPYGTVLGHTSDPDSLASALKSDRIEISAVFFGRTSGKWVFNVVQPLPESARGGGAAALIMTQNVEELMPFVAVGSMPADWHSALVDQTGKLIASSDATIGQVGGALNAELATPANTAIRATDFERNGEASIVARASVSGWAWRSYVWGPVRSGQASVLTSWRWLFVGGALLSLLSGVIVVLLAVRLRRAIRALSNMAAVLGAGEIVPPARTGISETDRVAYALTDASFDRAQAHERMHFVQRELVHRTKNMLTVVQSMLRQTARQAGTLDAFLPAANDRLSGLARSIDLLTEKAWGGVSLAALVRAQIATFVDGTDRIIVDGEDFLLKPDAVQNLGMAFHELGTNAIKYGALSVPRGRVRVAWLFTGEGEDARIFIEWKEVDGPPVEKSKRRGFGTTVLEGHAAASLGGTVKLSPEKDGLRWTVDTLRRNLEATPASEPAEARGARSPGE